MRVDLHIHTNISDGGESFQNILKKCQKDNIEYISITDHNSFRELSYLNEGYSDIKVINGMEIDVRYSKNMIFHILLYNYDPTSKVLKKYYYDNRRYEIKNFYKKIKQIEKRNNIILDKKKIKKFIKNNNYFDRVRLNNLLVFCEICSTPEEAYKKYTYSLSTNKRKSISLKRLFEIANESNGIVSFAHPMKYGLTIDLIESIILKLKNKYNLRVVEAINNHQTIEEQNELLKFCKDNNLYISAGSDSHFKLCSEKDEHIGIIKGNYIDSDNVTFLKLIDNKEVSYYE